MRQHLTKIYLLTIISFSTIINSSYIYAENEYNSSLLVLNLPTTTIDTETTVFLNKDSLTSLKSNCFYSTQLDANTHYLSLNNNSDSLEFIQNKNTSTYIVIRSNYINERIKSKAYLVDSMTALSYINEMNMEEKSKNNLLNTKIILYTEEISNVKYNFNINSEQISFVGSNSPYIFMCQAGIYKISNHNNTNDITISAKKNKTYYIKVFRNNSLETIAANFSKVSNLDDYVKAQKIVFGSIEKKKKNNKQKEKEPKKENAPIIRLTSNPMEQVGISLHPKKNQAIEKYFKKNRIGISFNVGGGFYELDEVSLLNGGYSSFSFGGGNGGKLKYGHESNNIDFLGEYSYKKSELSPRISNGSIEFTRKEISFTTSYVQFIIWKGNFKIRYGVGIDYYFNNNLKVDLANLIQTGVTGNLKYKNTLGYHIQLSFEAYLSSRLSLDFTEKLYGVKYNYQSGSVYHWLYGEGYITSDSFYWNPNGSGIESQLSINYYF